MVLSLTTRKTFQPIHALDKLLHSIRKTSSNHPLTSLQCGSLFQSLTNTKSFSKGQQLHAHLITSGTIIDNTYLTTKVAAFYANCGDMTSARVVFGGIASKNSFLWNFMIRGYACNGFSIKALALYNEMLGFGQKGDAFTYPFVIKACGDGFYLEIGKIAHAHVVVGGFESNVYVGNSMLFMYLKFGHVLLARILFDRMLVRDLTSWNTMISGLVKNGRPSEALENYYLMKHAGLFADGVTLLGLLSICCELASLRLGKEIHSFVIRNGCIVDNEILYNSIIEMYCKCNSMATARKLFENMRFKDVVSWNSLIAGYSRNEDAFESLRIFCRMVLELENVDQITLIAVLGSCHQIAALQFGMSVHSYLAKKGYGANAVVGTALLDMYAKCGSLASSRLVFDEMAEKNLFAWCAIISSYGVHGRGKEAVALFHEMIQSDIIPDDGVFTSVLSACSHAGMVAEGKEIFYRIMQECNVKPSVAHYSCLVDLLGRAGKIDEAYELIMSMDINPTSDMWASFLNACRVHQNFELAEIAGKTMLNLDSQQVGSYVCLSNIYAAEKRWDDVERVRALMKERGLLKPPGCSFVELDKRVHRFLVGDKSHQQMEDINSKLRDLSREVMKLGYKPDTSAVLYNVSEEIKEKMLWDHSERLAISFALINLHPETIIRITKNLRVCADCHTVIKLISKVTGREIIMRDIRRFHHFRDGICSCGDFW